MLRVDGKILLWESPCIKIAVFWFCTYWKVDLSTQLWFAGSNCMKFSSHNTAISLLPISFCVLVYFPPLRHHLCVAQLFNSSDRVASFTFLAGICSSFCVFLFWCSSLNFSHFPSGMYVFSWYIIFLLLWTSSSLLLFCFFIFPSKCSCQKRYQQVFKTVKKTKKTKTNKQTNKKTTTTTTTISYCISWEHSQRKKVIILQTKWQNFGEYGKI